MTREEAFAEALQRGHDSAMRWHGLMTSFLRGSSEAFARSIEHGSAIRKLLMSPDTKISATGRIVLPVSFGD